MNIGPDDVSIVDVSTTDPEYDYLGIDSAEYINESEGDFGNNEIVPEAELEKVRVLLKGRESILLQGLTAKQKEQ